MNCSPHWREHRPESKPPTGGFFHARYSAPMWLATAINPLPAAALYLVVASTCCAIVLLLVPRPSVAAIVGSMAAMAVTAVFCRHLPFQFWAHANDFIIEPFARGRIFSEPVVGLFSLLFHIGIPLLLTLGLARWSHRKSPPGLCPACGYDLRATPERCPECGVVPGKSN